MQRAGVPKAAVDCLFSTLQQARHHVRTRYGDSVHTYGGEPTDESPMHGICQGNGAGPSIWAVVSSPILNMMRKKKYENYVSPITKTNTSFVGYAFVDNTDLLRVLSALSQAGAVVTSMQEALDAWEGGLKVTGGAIVPEKTFWYLIDFKWKQGEWSYKNSSQSPGHLWVNNVNNSRTKIRRV
jgi:hypothetical protein